jgi:hypothetical protein
MNKNESWTHDSPAIANPISKVAQIPTQDERNQIKGKTSFKKWSNHFECLCMTSQKK